MLRSQFHVVRSFSRQLSTKAQDQSRLRLQILASALNHVPKTGWTNEALALGAVEAGFSPATHGIFERGAIELVEYFMEESAYETSRILEEKHDELIKNKTTEEKMITIIELRLDQLKPYINTWPQAMTLGLHPNNSSTTIRNLALLSDEMCHNINLSQTDINWYCDRAIVGSVYAAAEIFMLSDQSENYLDTSEFVKRRINEAMKLSLSSDNHTNVDDKIKTILSSIPHVSKPILTGMKEMIHQTHNNNSKKSNEFLSSTGQFIFSTLSSIIPAGYPPQRDPQSNPRQTSSSPHQNDGASSSSSSHAPKEDDIASKEEMDYFDEQHEVSNMKK